MGFMTKSLVISSFADSTTSTADLNSYTLSMENMLTTGHRVIAVVGRAASNRTISTVTLDGESATILGSQINNGGTSCALFIAPATGNATGDCVVTLVSSTWLRCGVGVYNVRGLQSTTPTGTASDTVHTSNVLSVSIDVDAGGAAFGVVSLSGGAGWTLAGIDEDVDITIDSPAISLTCGHKDFAAAQSALTVSATYGSAPSAPVMSVVALR